MLEIYGSPQSSAGRCYWCLEEVNADYKGRGISFKDNEHKSEDFLKKNPNGKVPVLIDDNFALSESMAINFYLAEKYKPELLGKNIEDKAKVRQWSFWALADLQTPIINIFIQKVFVPEERRSQAVIDKNLKKLPSLLASLNKNLNNQSYLVSSEFTVADLNVHSVVSILKAIEVSLDEYPNIIEWMENINNRPSYLKYLKVVEEWS